MSQTLRVSARIVRIRDVGHSVGFACAGWPALSTSRRRQLQPAARISAGLPACRGSAWLGGAEATPDRPGSGLGFHASARTLVKLHVVSSQLFLPAGVLQTPRPSSE